MAQDGYVTPTIRASGTTFTQLKAGGLAAMIDRLIAANPAIAAGVAATATATGGGASGGLLEAATYTLRYTYVNGFGESLPSTVSANLVVSATNIPRVTFPALPTGAGSRNLYVITAAGRTYLYATGITTTTFDMAVALASSSDVNRSAVPTVDTTAASASAKYLGLPTARHLQLLWDRAHQSIDNFVSGRPVNLTELKLQNAQTAAAFKALATILDEAGVLISANAGTLATTTNAAGERVAVRTFA